MDTLLKLLLGIAAGGMALGLIVLIAQATVDMLPRRIRAGDCLLCCGVELRVLRNMPPCPQCKRPPGAKE